MSRTGPGLRVRESANPLQRIVVMRGSMRLIFLLLAAAGCSGRMQYLPPATVPPVSSSKVIAASRADVWQRAVAELGKSYFSINVSDADGGLLNLSFSGNPEEYLDCGTITSAVKNLAGSRSYEFPAARRSQIYEIMRSGSLHTVNRSLTMEGRANLVFETLAARSTRVSANAEFTLVRKMEAVQAGTGQKFDRTDRTTVTTARVGGLPQPAAGMDGEECRSTGKLEAELLALVK